MTAPTTDFSIFDGRELVTYEPAGGGPIADVQAVRRPLTQSRQRNVERYVTLEATDVVFHLDGGPLSSAALAAGDTITTADSQSYGVLFIERQSLGETAAAICRPT